MKLYAQVTPDGSIQSMILAPEGDVSCGVDSEPGFQVLEVQNHGLTNEATPEQLAKILTTKAVSFTPTQGKLVARKK